METSDNDLEKILSCPKNKSTMGRENFSQEVGYFLVGQNMHKYVDTFRDHNVTFDMLLHLNDKDLKILGVDDPTDRQQLLKSIQISGSKSQSIIVPPNIDEDILIANNLLSQSQALERNLAYLLKSINTFPLWDYHVEGDHSALPLARILAAKSLQQIQMLKNSIYEKKSSDCIINQISLKSGVPLPIKAKRSLEGKRKKKFRKPFIIVSAIALFVSILAVGTKLVTNKLS